MWRVWAPTGQQTCTRVPQSALLIPPGHLHVLARVLVGGRRRAAVALRRAALQAQRHASGGTDPFRGRWTWRLLLRCDLREVTSLRPRGFAEPEVAYCANASVGARHPASTLAVSASATHTRNRRSVNGPSVCVAWGLHGPMAAHKPSPLRFWRIDSFNCWSAVAGWPEKTGNSPLAQSRRCR